MALALAIDVLDRHRSPPAAGDASRGGRRHHGPNLRGLCPSVHRQGEPVQVGRAGYQHPAAGQRGPPGGLRLQQGGEGSEEAEQLADNLSCLDLTLSPELVGRLDEASRIEKGSRTTFTTGTSCGGWSTAEWRTASTPIPSD
jgi:hypothetical protein